MLAAVAVATLLAIPDDVIQAGLEQYTGVARRLEMLGEVFLPKTCTAILASSGRVDAPRSAQNVHEAVARCQPA